MEYLLSYGNNLSTDSGHLRGGLIVEVYKKVTCIELFKLSWAFGSNRGKIIVVDVLKNG